MNCVSEQWTTVEGWRIFARVAEGGAPTNALPIVCVHGLGVSSRYFVPLLEALAPTHPAHALDLPGSGRSEGPAGALTIAALADFLADWMSAAGFARAALLGNSFGCQVIAAFALRHPERIAAAVLTGPTGDPAERSPVHLLLRLGLDGLREPPSEVLIALRDYWRFGFRRGIATARMMVEDDMAEKLTHVRVPILVVRGGRDAIVTQAWAETVAALAPDGRLIVIPGAAHAVNYDTPKEVAAAVNHFLASAS